MASTRLPGKPLADINGKPMIVRVLERCMEAGIGPVIVATPDCQIANVAVKNGFRPVITDGGLASGSDAVWDAIQKFDPDEKHDVVVNVQGDQVGVTTRHIVSSFHPLADWRVQIGTLVAPLDGPDCDDMGIVKAIVLLDSGQYFGKALYFSRLPIPLGPGPMWRHIGIYAYRRDALKNFTAMKPSSLELRERLEQLRALENDMIIGCCKVDSAPLEVNTQADLDRVRGLIH